MERILDRIEKITKNEGIKITSLEKIIGASKGVLSRAINNGTDIQAKWIQAIVENYPLYSEAWLLTGKGGMLKSDNASPSYISNVDDDLVTIPIVDVEAAAGHGFINPDYPEKTGEIKLPSGMLSRRTGNYYCGLVHGNSMYPTLLDRDYIIFRTLHPGEWELIRNGEIYFIIDRFGKSYVKRVINRLREENHLVCTSDNKEGNFPDFNMMGDEIGSVYHVECRLSNNIANLNDYNSQLKYLREDIEMIKDKLKHL